MKNERMLLLCAVTVIIVMGLLFIYDCMRPKSLDAQTCVSIKPIVTITTFENRGDGYLGCFHFCAVGGLWGIDDRGDEGFAVNKGIACGDGQYNWTFDRGGDVDGSKVYCMNVTN
jgi:hypothetical protein